MMPNSWYRTPVDSMGMESTRPEDFHRHKTFPGKPRKVPFGSATVAGFRGRVDGNQQQLVFQVVVFFWSLGKMDVNFHRLITNTMHHNNAENSCSCPSFPSKHQPII